MKYVILGLIQGLTEFLPVSSSGHLVIFQKLLNVSAGIPFDITVHLATLLAVIIYFRRDLIEIIKQFFASFFKIFRREIGFVEAYNSIEYFRLAWLLLLATMVTAVIGYKFSDFFENLFSSTKAVGSFLILTGIIIFIAEAFPKGKKDIQKMNLWDSFVIGLAQAAAIAPGLSRSGTTVSASLMRGLNRELAARFSFLLSIPIILGAGIFEIKKIADAPDLWPLLLGAVSAFLSGYLAIWAFMGIISKGSIRGFAYYCAAIGIAVLILL